MTLSDYLKQPPNFRLAKRLHGLNVVVTISVLVLVGLMRRVKLPLPDGFDLGFLPPVYSAINAVAAMLLILALVMIKQGNIRAHRRAINCAMACSLLFLLCYVVYHFTTPETRFGGEGWIKFLYLILLISHIVLAAVSLPFILLTWSWGITNQFDKHRRLARWVFPVWLYVAVTGPICYLMLRPYY